MEVLTVIAAALAFARGEAAKTRCRSARRILEITHCTLYARAAVALSRYPRDRSSRRLRASRVSDSRLIPRAPRRWLARWQS